MWNGSALAAPSIQIKYRAFACDAPQRASPVATQSLKVINVNDAPALLYPARAFAVYAGVAESDDEFPSTVLLEGLELTDADRDVDAVRVTVAARFPTSMLSMDAALLPLADFNSDRDCFGRGASGWRCEGDGSGRLPLHLRRDAVGREQAPQDPELPVDRHRRPRRRLGRGL